VKIGKVSENELGLSKDSAQRTDVCEYTHPASKLTISERWAPELLAVGAGGILGREGLGYEVSWLRHSCGGVPVPLHLQHICQFIAVALWQARHLAVWYWQTIARCFSVGYFTFLCPGNSTPHLFSAQTLAQGQLISDTISCIVACKNLSLAVVAISKARWVSDYSSYTRPLCLPIVADMLNTCSKFVAASNNEIRLLPLQSMLPQPPLQWLMPVLSTHRYAHPKIGPQYSHT
jgi:hypothetical protein